MTFEPHPRAEDRKRSAVALMELLLDNEKTDILPEHRRELLKILLGKITEADGKYTTRHMSLCALECTDKKHLRHDHVYPRARMIEDLMTATRPGEVEAILENAIACTVTLDEHVRLSMFDKEHHGWERYRRAKVAVKNTETGEVF